MVLEKINWYLCKPLVALSSTRKMHSLQIHNCKILSIAQYFLSSLTICVMHLFLRTHNFQFVHIVQFVFRVAFKKIPEVCAKLYGYSILEPHEKKSIHLTNFLRGNTLSQICVFT